MTDGYPYTLVSDPWVMHEHLRVRHPERYSQGFLDTVTISEQQYTDVMRIRLSGKISM